MADIATLQATDMLTAATNSNASDIFIIAGRPLTYKVNGFMHTKGERLMPDITESLIRQIYILAQNRKIDPFLESGDDDFSVFLVHSGFLPSVNTRKGAEPAPLVKNYLSSRQATPGSSLPSMNSSDAPPPVETWVTLSA